MGRTDLLDSITNAFTDLTASVPVSTEPKSDDAPARARALTLKAASEASLVAGALSLPPGPLGMLTVLPDLIAVWNIQRQLVADIAACHGRTHAITRETMIYCLFRHAAAQIVRDFVVRAGERLLIRRASLNAIQRLLRRVGIVVSQRVAGRTLSRWLPIVGAVGIGAYAFYDTAQVGKTAQKLFEKDVEVESETGQ